MSLSSGSSKLNLGLKTLRVHWDETKVRWKDPVSQAFEEGHLEPLEAQVVVTLRAIDRLAITLSRGAAGMWLTDYPGILASVRLPLKGTAQVCFS